MRRSRKGNSIVEFTLVGIPLMFILISVFEVSRGMWVYHTLAYAVKDTARYAAVHGQACLNAGAGCPVTVAAVATHLRDAGAGLLPNYFNVTMSTNTRTVTCSPLNSCLADTTCFPAAANCTSFDPGAAQGSPVTITGTYPFASAISMFAPFGGSGGIVFGTFNLPATAREAILF
jgi:Flp pilus assembly protein TadG